VVENGVWRRVEKVKRLEVLGEEREFFWWVEVWLAG